MNMAMRQQPDLPTPFPVGVNGMGSMGWEWADLVDPLGYYRNIATAAAVTPVSQWATTLPSALPVVGGANFVNSYTGPAPKKPVKPTNYASIYNNPSHDQQHDTQGLIKDFTGYDSAPSAWLVNNWKWLALLGGVLVLVRVLKGKK